MNTLSTPEVVALFHVDPVKIRKDIKLGILPPGPPSWHELAYFDLADVVYICMVLALGFEVESVDDRKRFHEQIRAAVTRPEQLDRVYLDGFGEVEIGTVVREVEERAARFEAWRHKVRIDYNYLAGSPVFPKTRLSMEYIGFMRLDGESVERILADYPYIQAEDVEFAAQFVAAFQPMVPLRERTAPAGRAALSQHRADPPA
jgi:uncharacterized protein (DUF433 family)